MVPSGCDLPGAGMPPVGTFKYGNRLLIIKETKILLYKNIIVTARDLKHMCVAERKQCHPVSRILQINFSVRKMLFLISVQLKNVCMPYR